MAYNDKSKQNLKPFTGAGDPRRQNGRKKGQINRRTAIRNLLTQEVDPRFLLDDKARGRAENLKGSTYLEAIIYTLTNQALGEETRASDLLLRELRQVDKENPPELPMRQGFKIEVVQSRDEIERLQALEGRIRSQIWRKLRATSISIALWAKMALRGFICVLRASFVRGWSEFGVIQVSV